MEISANEHKVCLQGTQIHPLSLTSGKSYHRFSGISKLPFT